MCMVIFTLCFTLGVWLLQQQAMLPSFAPAWGLICFIPALVISGKTPVQRIVRTLLIAAFACGTGFYYAAWQGEQRLAASLPAQWQGRDIELVGAVAEMPRFSERGSRFKFTVEKTLTPGVTVPKHLYLSTYLDTRNPTPDIHAAERWQLTVRLKQPHGSSNPHTFDFELWALENDIRAVGYVNNRGKNHLFATRASGLFYRVETWREAVRDKFSATLGSAPYTGVLTALAIGDQGSIPQAQWQIFTRTGINHLMSISGLHITMLAGMAFTLIYRLWRRSERLTLWLPAKKAATIAAVLVAYGYSLLAGYGIPAQRTVYMVAAVAAALWLNRNFSLGQIFSLALLGVLIPDPWAVLSPGFWLSFGAVALILYVSAHRIKRVDSKTRLLTSYLREYAIVQWAMCIGLIPLLLALFGQVSLASPIANAFAIPLVSLIVVPLTLAGAALPTEVPLWLAHIALDATMVPLTWMSSLPQAVWIQHIPPPWSIVTGMLGVLWVLLPRGFPARWLGLLLMLPMFLNSPMPPKTGTARLVIFDVGQGLSVFVQTRQHTLLYDTGPDLSGSADSGNRILVPSLKGMGITSLDGLILSHDDLDHTGGTASILQNIQTGWILSSKPMGANPSIGRCQDGMNWNWDGVRFEILHPDQNVPVSRAHDNNQSCVLRIGTGSQHVLLTGDIGKRTELRLINVHADQLPANVLVVPHHGSASSSDIEFISAVLPDYAVFTNGYLNRFGHPKAEVLRRYMDSGAIALRSDMDGAILIDMSLQDLTIERYRRTHRRYWTHLSD